MKELWQNEKSRAGITLGLWLLFIGFIIILVSCSSNKEVTAKPSKNNINIENIINELLNNKISYKITKEIDNNKVVYEVSYKDHIYEGYIEETSGISKFRCDLNTCYKIFLDHEEEQSDYYFKDELDIFNLKKIASDLKLNKDFYYYEKDNISYKIYLKHEIIDRVVINKDNMIVTYDINYNL